MYYLVLVRFDSVPALPLTLSFSGYESSGSWQRRTRACFGVEAAAVRARFEALLCAG